MADVLPMTTLKADVPTRLWDKYLSIRQDLRSPTDSYFLTALLQAFLKLDDATQLAVLYDGHVPALVNPDWSGVDNDLLQGDLSRLMERQ